ncbi:TPA: hypothetical protein MI845_28270, partial [Klebsiella pneumoniae]|nr:hypothetical protein [Klebsiella pneumoniae]
MITDAVKTFPHPDSHSDRPFVSCPGPVGCRKRLHARHLLTDARDSRRGLTLSGTKTHVKQRFLPLTPLLMVSD